MKQMYTEEVENVRMCFKQVCKPFGQKNSQQICEFRVCSQHFTLLDHFLFPLSQSIYLYKNLEKNKTTRDFVFSDNVCLKLHTSGSAGKVR